MRKEIQPLFFFLTLGMLLFFAYGIVSIFNFRKYILGTAFFTCFAAGIISIIMLLRSSDKRSSTRFFLIAVIGLLSTILIDGGTNTIAPIWCCVVPLAAFYTQGLGRGIRYSALFGAIIALIIILKSVNAIHTAYPTETYAEILFSLLIVSSLTFVYESYNVKYKSNIKHQLYHCPLTNLPNRTKLLYDLQKISRDATLFLLNIDDFKEINSSFGNSAGDKLLIKAGERLAKLHHTRLSFNIYKLHADEFAILVDEKPSPSDITALAEQMLLIFSEKFEIPPVEIDITATIGISSGTGDLLRDTDIALKTAKSRNKPFLIYNDSMNFIDQYQQNTTLLRVLRNAIATNKVVPFFQPIMCNASDKVFKYESLIRINNGDAFFSPDTFLELSKRSKIYPELTKIMIRKSFEFFQDRNDHFSVNLSYDDLLNKETVRYITESLDKFPVNNRVIFELLETDQLAETDEVLQFIREMKKRGCQIAIDDFGTGYSNFDYILKMNADYLKIDSSLVKDLENNNHSQIIVETIVNFTKKLGIKTIAEFVHNEAILHMVKEIGIDFSQGYHIGKPSQMILN